MRHFRREPSRLPFVSALRACVCVRRKTLDNSSKGKHLCIKAAQPEPENDQQGSTRERPKVLSSGPFCPQKWCLQRRSEDGGGESSHGTCLAVHSTRRFSDLAPSLPTSRCGEKHLPARTRAPPECHVEPDGCGMLTRTRHASRQCAISWPPRNGVTLLGPVPFARSRPLPVPDIPKNAPEARPLQS